MHAPTFRRLNLRTCLALFAAFFAAITSLCAEEYTLDDLFRIALKLSERIKVAEEEVAIAERGKDKALSALLPKLSSLADYRAYNRQVLGSTGLLIQPDTSVSGTIRLDQSVSLGGREFTGLTISKDTVKKTQYDLYGIREDYLTRVAAAYYDVFRTKRAEEIAAANVARLAKHRDAARTRLQVGEVTKTALLRAEAELSGAKSDLVKAKNAYDLARAFLTRIVGIPEDFSLKGMEGTIRDEQSALSGSPEENGSWEAAEVAVLIQNCPGPVLSCLKEKAQSERAEILSLDLQKRIATENVRFTIGSYWPTLSAEGVYLRRDENPPTASLIRESVYGGVRITLPIFEGGLRNAEVGEAQSRLRQARLNLDDLRKTVNIEVESAYLDLKTQVGVMKSLEDQVAFARDNYSATSKQFDFGLANSIEVMDANTVLVTSERQLIDAQFNYQLSLLRMKRATGMLLKMVTAQVKGDQ